MVFRRLGSLHTGRKSIIERLGVLLVCERLSVENCVVFVPRLDRKQRDLSVSASAHLLAEPGTFYVRNEVGQRIGT